MEKLSKEIIAEKIKQINEINFIDPFNDINVRISEIFKVLNKEENRNKIKEYASQIDDVLEKRRSLDDKEIYEGIKNEILIFLNSLNE